MKAGGGVGRRSRGNPEECVSGLLVPVARRGGTWRRWGTGRRGRSGTGGGDSQQALLWQSLARRRCWGVCGASGMGWRRRGAAGFKKRKPGISGGVLARGLAGDLGRRSRRGVLRAAERATRASREGEGA